MKRRTSSRRSLTGGSLIAASMATFVVLLAGCSADQPAVDSEPATSSSAGTGASSESTASGDTLFPDVVKVEVTGSRDKLSFAVTMTSSYDSPERYADGMRVRSADGKTVYGERELTHDHASEQPFTRSIDGVSIPAEVSEVVVEGRDQVSGWGGGTQKVDVSQ